MTSTPPHNAGQASRHADDDETTVLAPVSDDEQASDDAAVSDDVVVSDDAPISTDAAAPDRAPTKRPVIWIVVTALLVALLIAASVIIYRLVDVSNKWEAQVEEVKAQNYDLGQRLADEQTHAVELQGQLDTVSEQLRTAQQRVLELADDVAQRDDNAEFYARQITDLTNVLSTAATVANSLNKCVDYEQQLIGYLKDPDNYDPAEVDTFEKGVNQVCDAATAANVDLQTALAK